MKKVWIENYYQGNYAVHIRKRKKFPNGFDGLVWTTIGWVKKMKNGSWNTYHLNKQYRWGKLMKSGFKRRKDAVDYIIKRKG